MGGGGQGTLRMLTGAALIGHWRSFAVSMSESRRSPFLHYSALANVPLGMIFVARRPGAEYACTGDPEIVRAPRLQGTVTPAIRARGLGCMARSAGHCHESFQTAGYGHPRMEASRLLGMDGTSRLQGM